MPGVPMARSVWVWWGIFALIVLALLYVRLLPIGGLAGGFPGPDLVMCLICAWVIRRPAFVPVVLVAAVILLEDMVLMRPPGLWAGIMVLGSEFLRARTALSRELSFVAEWVMVAVVMFAMVMGARLLMAVMFVPQPAFVSQMIGLLFSILAYPVVVGVSRLVFGLNKPATGEVDAIGRPL